MSPLDALLLGLLQGLTEFLPISSSGHLVLAQEALGVEESGVALEVAVHAGTLLSVLLYYRRDVWSIAHDMVGGGPAARLGWLVAAGSVPVVLVGLFLKDAIDDAFESPRAAAAGLLVTGVFLLLTRLARRRPGEQTLRYAIVVGLAQAVAILPGVSRSGSTIGAGLLLGDDAVRAARFSFLLSIPAIAGAALVKALDGDFANVGQPGLVLLAAAVAFASGLAAIAWLLKILAKGRMWIFGPYCLLAGAAAWALLQGAP